MYFLFEIFSGFLSVVVGIFFCITIVEVFSSITSDAVHIHSLGLVVVGPFIIFKFICDGNSDLVDVDDGGFCEL